MLAEARTFWSGAPQFFSECSRVLSSDLEHWASRTLTGNRQVQCALFVANHCYLMGLRERGIDARCSLGLSLGEYNHLVHVGALDVMDALRLVEQRGTLYDGASGGGMLAVFPIELPRLEQLVGRAREHGHLAIANYNSRSQFVVAGSLPALDALAAILDAEDYAHARFIDRQRAMHSRLFSGVADALKRVLVKTPFREPSGSYLPNVLGVFASSARPDDVRELLYRHVAEPVLWSHSIECVLHTVQNPVFVEVGPGKVLSNLLRSSWKGVPVATVESLRGPAVHATASGAP